MRIRYYASPISGREYVREYINALPSKERAQVLSELLDVQGAESLSEAGVVTRQIKGKLWELKVSAERVFYVVISGPEMVLLHAYRKRGQKAPLREIEVATERMKEVLAEVAAAETSSIESKRKKS
ncbi:MAG: type II toxin-antitoxin system RelE/ParE family toxin [Myxococcaceae bacterium]|nr:type II toxin-antitoxin system RelE/ParE family toxin [Myxococcaceae bacterium]